MDKMGVFLILGMLMLLAFGLRLYRLEAKSLWQEEGSAPTEPAKACLSSSLTPSSIGVE